MYFLFKYSLHKLKIHNEMKLNYSIPHGKLQFCIFPFFYYNFTVTIS